MKSKAKTKAKRWLIEIIKENFYPLDYEKEENYGDELYFPNEINHYGHKYLHTLYDDELFFFACEQYDEFLSLVICEHIGKDFILKFIDKKYHNMVKFNDSYSISDYTKKEEIIKEIFKIYGRDYLITLLKFNMISIQNHNEYLRLQEEKEKLEELNYLY